MRLTASGGPVGQLALLEGEVHVKVAPALASTRRVWRGSRTSYRELAWKAPVLCARAVRLSPNTSYQRAPEASRLHRCCHAALAWASGVPVAPPPDGRTGLAPDRRAGVHRQDPDGLAGHRRRGRHARLQRRQPRGDRLPPRLHLRPRCAARRGLPVRDDMRLEFSEPSPHRKRTVLFQFQPSSRNGMRISPTAASASHAPRTGVAERAGRGRAGTCAEIMPCASPDTNTCSADAACNHVGPDQYSCSCTLGFKGDGHTCDDIDGCANFPCAHQVTCYDQPAPATGFDCGPCPEGAEGDGLHCAASVRPRPTPPPSGARGAPNSAGPNSPKRAPCSPPPCRRPRGLRP